MAFGPQCKGQIKGMGLFLEPWSFLVNDGLVPGSLPAYSYSRSQRLKLFPVWQADSWPSSSLVYQAEKQQSGWIWRVISIVKDSSCSKSLVIFCIDWLLEHFQSKRWPPTVLYHSSPLILHLLIVILMVSIGQYGSDCRKLLCNVFCGGALI